MEIKVSGNMQFKFMDFKWPAIIFSLSLLIGIVAGLILKNFNEYTYDVDGFGKLAAHFADNFNFDGSARRAPVYPLLLGLVYHFFGNYNDLAMITFHSIFLGLVGVTVYYIAQKLFNDKSAAVFIALFISINPILLWYIPYYFLEIVFAYFVLMTVWFSYLAYTTHKIKNGVLFGIFAGISSLIKGIILLFPIYILISLLIIRFIKPSWVEHSIMKRMLKTGAVSILFMMIIIFPWTLRNKIVKGEWILISTNAGVEFFRGNVFAEENSYMLNKGMGPIFSKAVNRENKLIHELGIDNPSEVQLDSIFNPMMVDFITKQPGQFALKTIKQIPAFWTLSTNQTTAIIRLAIFLCTFSLFILGWKKNPIRFNLFVTLTIIYFNLIYAAIYTCARYSFPLYPLMMISGGYLVFEVTKKIFIRKYEQQSKQPH